MNFTFGAPTTTTTTSTNTNTMPPSIMHYHHTASPTIKRRCDSMEEDNQSFHSQEEVCHQQTSNKRIKSSHHQGSYPQDQYRQPIQFVSSNNSAFFTFGQQGATPFQRQP